MKYFLPSLLLYLISAQASACTLAISPVSGAAIDLASQDPSPVMVAQITESCADSSGYAISFSSANNSSLHSDRASYPYRLSYNGSAFQSLGSPVIFTYNSISTVSQKAVTLLVAPQPDAIAGSYSDIITAQISGR